MRSTAERDSSFQSWKLNIYASDCFILATKDKAMVACIYVIMLILQAVAVNSQTPAILSVTNVIPGATATFECSFANLASSTSLHVYKDNLAFYACPKIAFTCSKTTVDNDYSDVTFTALGTASAKGTFTVANADQTRDGGNWTCQYGTSSLSSQDTFVVSAPRPATFSVTNIIQGALATFECSYPHLESPTTLDISKDGVALYTCTDIALTCSKSITHNHYSDVTFKDLDTASAKGKFTVANADQTRDGGEWTCTYGISLISSSITFVVIAQSPATFSVTNVLQGATATFECSYPIMTSPTTLYIYKDSVALFQCTNIAFTCGKTSSDPDYSDVTFTALGTASAKGTFTVTNADRTRDGGDWTCQYGTSFLSSPDTFVVTAPATFSVANVLQEATATFECSYPSLTSPTPLDIYKDNVALYQCTDIALTCSKSSTDNDYSDVTFTNLGTALAKGTFTVTNADQTRDGGEWTCKYGTSIISPSVTFVVSDDSSSCPSSCIGASVAGGVATIVGIVVVVWCCCCRHLIGYITITKVTHDSIQLRWSMEGLHPKNFGLKAICGEQHRKVGHEEDGTHTVNFQNVSLGTSVTICMEFTNKDGRHGKKILMEIQTMKDHFRDMTIERVTLDTIYLRWSMNGFHPGTLGLKAICKIQDPRMCLELDGTHTVTVENLAPDTSITIYLEYTDQDEAHCKETLIHKQTMKDPTVKPKGLPPLERGSAAAYTPRHGHDGEETHTKPGLLPPINKFTGIPESSDGHNTRSHSITDKDSINCKVHVQD